MCASRSLWLKGRDKSWVILWRARNPCFKQPINRPVKYWCKTKREIERESQCREWEWEQEWECDIILRKETNREIKNIVCTITSDDMNNNDGINSIMFSLQTCSLISCIHRNQFYHVQSTNMFTDIMYPWTPPHWQSGQIEERASTSWCFQDSQEVWKKLIIG